MPKAKVTKISETSPEYQTNIKTNQMFYGEAAVFGAEVLEGVNFIGEDASFFIPHDQDWLTREIKQSRWNLRKIYSRPEKREYVRSLYQNSAREVVKSLPPLSGAETSWEGSIIESLGVDVPSAVDNLFDPQLVSDIKYVRILKHHNDLFKKKVGDFELRKPEYQENLLKRLREASYIPSHVKQLADGRLKDTIFTLEDALTATLEERFGSFSIVNGKVSIAEQVPKDLEEHVFTHEALHALSGRTIIVRRFDGDPYGAVEHQRVGLRIYEFGKFENFRWLNEAITEELTLGLLEKEESKIYFAERYLMKLLGTNGSAVIPFELFVNAYFEDYDPSKPPGERIPEWKKLYGAINEAYAPGFLTRLDAFVKANGIVAAFETMAKDWHVIMDTETRAEKKSRVRKENTTKPKDPAEVE